MGILDKLKFWQRGNLIQIEKENPNLSVEQLVNMARFNDKLDEIGGKVDGVFQAVKDTDAHVLDGNTLTHEKENVLAQDIRELLTLVKRGDLSSAEKKAEELTPKVREIKEEIDTSHNVLDIVINNPGTTAKGIEKLSGVAYTTVKYHLDNLVTSGKIRQNGQRGAKYFYIKP